MTSDEEGTVSAGVLHELARTAALLGMSPDAAMREKIQEIKIRHFLRCFPNERIKPTQLKRFVQDVLGSEPSPDFLSTLAKTKRRPRISEEELIWLEESQNGRCALCGVLLSRVVSPQVDHRVPVALGGVSDMSNYQLLCRKCNLGKSKLIGWIMGAPFFSGSNNKLSAKLRYCTLVRHDGICQLGDCDHSSETAALVVLPRISVGQGGRWIFDNLTVLCDSHARERDRKHINKIRLRIRHPRVTRKQHDET